MSIKLMSQVWDSPYARTSHAKLLVMLKLADHASDEGWCFPSQQRIANMCNLSRESVNRIIKTLEDDKVLEIHRAVGKHNRYQLRFDNIPVISDHTPTPVTSDHRYLCAEITPPVTSDHTNHHVTVIEDSVPNGTGDKVAPPAKILTAHDRCAEAYFELYETMPDRGRQFKALKAMLDDGHGANEIIGELQRQFTAGGFRACFTSVQKTLVRAKAFIPPFQPASQNGKLIPTSPPRLSDLPTLADLPVRSIGGVQ